VDAFAHGGREGSERAIRELLDLGGWRALSELRAAGDVAAIGAGVNEWQPCVRLLEVADPDIFLLAGRYTLLEQEPLDTLLPQCAAKRACVVIGGPYNSGVLAGQSTYNYGAIPEDVAARVRALGAVCDAHRIPMARAALQFAAAHPIVVSVIPGGQNVAEMRQNATLLDEHISNDFWEDLRQRQLIRPGSPTPS